ncbi:MAG: very short patch repair endonuclease [archaeon]|nr:very short patch repair endonuclease [archaeon]
MEQRKRNPKITSKIMSQIRSKHTKIELLLAKEFRKSKIKFRRYQSLPGKPDFIIYRKKIAIFCDGDFWHGNNWKIRGMKNQNEEFSKLSDFWIKKIKRNILRDKQINKLLKKMGWIVLRFWESKIKKSPKKIIKKIEKTIKDYSDHN